MATESLDRERMQREAAERKRSEEEELLAAKDSWSIPEGREMIRRRLEQLKQDADDWQRKQDFRKAQEQRWEKIQAEIEDKERMWNQRKREWHEQEENHRLRMIALEREWHHRQSQKEQEWASVDAARAANQLLLSQPEKRGWRKLLGRSAWLYLHTVAARFPETPTKSAQEAARALVHSFRDIFPCESCRVSIAAHMEAQGLVDVSSGRSFSLWACGLHNRVNKDLGKPEFACSQKKLEKLFLGECDECDREGLVSTQLAHKGGFSCPLKVLEWIQNREKDRDHSCTTILFFWSPGNVLSRAQLPLLDAWLLKYRDSGLGVISIVEIKDESARHEVEDTISKLEISFPVASAPHQSDTVTYAYGRFVGNFNGVPAAIVLHDCHELWRGFGGQINQLEPFLKKHFADVEAAAAAKAAAAGLTGTGHEHHDHSHQGH